MKKARIDLDRVIIADHQAAVVTQPRKGSFHNPAVSVAPKFASVLVGGMKVVAARRDDRLDATFGQSLPQSVAIVASVQDQSVGSLARTPGTVSMPDRDGLQGLLQQVHFRWGRRVQVCSQRSTLAIDQNQPLCALSPLGLADGRPPFFAGAKLPSPKHSFQRIFWASLRSARKARHRSSKTPLVSHSRSLRHTVLGLPYSRGSSLHWEPVRRIQRMPSKHCRSGTLGRPPLRLAGCSGRCSQILSHCLSVSRILAMPLTGKFHARF